MVRRHRHRHQSWFLIGERFHNNDDLSAANMFLFYSSSSSSAGTDNRPPMNVVLIHAILIGSDDCNTIDRPTPRMIRQTTSPRIIIHILASISRHLCPFSGSLINEYCEYHPVSWSEPKVIKCIYCTNVRLWNGNKCTKVLCDYLFHHGDRRRKYFWWQLFLAQSQTNL